MFRSDFGFYSWPEPLGSDASAYHEVRQAALDREWGLARKAGFDVDIEQVNMTDGREYARPVRFRDKRLTWITKKNLQVGQPRSPS